MTEIQPSFYQWRKKVNAALAMDPARVTLVYVSPEGRNFSIEPEELQTPREGHYTAKFTGGNGEPQVVTAEFAVEPERTIRRAPEDTFIARYERMADDLEHARLASESRARAAEAEKLAALETVAAQHRRIQELELQIDQLEQQNEGLLDDDTAALILEVVDHWTGAAELRDQVSGLLSAIEEDPRVAERVARRVPELIASLVQSVKSEM